MKNYLGVKKDEIHFHQMDSSKPISLPFNRVSLRLRDQTMVVGKKRTEEEQKEKKIISHCSRITDLSAYLTFLWKDGRDKYKCQAAAISALLNRVQDE